MSTSGREKVGFAVLPEQNTMSKTKQMLKINEAGKEKEERNIVNAEVQSMSQTEIFPS